MFEHLEKMRGMKAKSYFLLEKKLESGEEFATPPINRWQNSAA